MDAENVKSGNIDQNEIECAGCGTTKSPNDKDWVHTGIGSFCPKCIIEDDPFDEDDDDCSVCDCCCDEDYRGVYRGIPQ